MLLGLKMDEYVSCVICMVKSGRGFGVGMYREMTPARSIVLCLNFFFPEYSKFV